MLVVQGLFQHAEALPAPTRLEEWIDLYRTIPWVYAAVAATANTIAALDLQLKRRKKGSDDPELVTDHPALDLLKNPNPDNTAYTLLESTVIYLETTGEAYWEVVSDSAGKSKLAPKELYILRPSRMKPIPSKDGTGIEKYIFQVRTNSRKIEYDPDEIVHFEYFNPLDDWRGLSPLHAAIDQIRTEKQVSKWNLDFFKNGTCLDGILTTDQILTTTDMRAVREMWKDMVSGKGRIVPVLGRNLKFQPIGVNPKEVDFKGTRKDNATSILGVLGVPPIKVGILDQAKYDNYFLQEQAFYRGTIVPKLRKLEAALNKHFLPLFGENDAESGDELYFEFDTKSLVTEDSDRLTARLVQQIGVGLISPNEGRKEMGRDPYPAGDKYYLSSSFVPIEQAGQQPQGGAFGDGGGKPPFGAKSGDDKSGKPPFGKKSPFGAKPAAADATAPDPKVDDAVPVDKNEVEIAKRDDIILAAIKRGEQDMAAMLVKMRAEIKAELLVDIAKAHDV
jgi:HK97 family phage portal protein